MSSISNEGFLFVYFQLLIGFESGAIVMWDLKSKTADMRYNCTEVSHVLYIFNIGPYMEDMPTLMPCYFVVSCHGLYIFNIGPYMEDMPMLMPCYFVVSCHVLYIFNIGPYMEDMPMLMPFYFVVSCHGLYIFNIGSYMEDMPTLMLCHFRVSMYIYQCSYGSWKCCKTLASHLAFCKHFKVLELTKSPGKFWKKH